LRTLSAIFAHPDDETFSSGGTLAKYAAADVRCTLFVATDGDAGRTSGLQVGSREELGHIRRSELHAAARVLGLQSVDTPGYPDGALGAVDQDELIGRIVAHFRRERPQVVITFGPEGAPNAHGDHRAISRGATAAFFLAGNRGAFGDQLEGGLAPHAPARLFYVSWPPPSPDAELTVLAVPATARIDVRDFMDVERDAWAAHVSQHALQQRFDQLAATEDELFALAAGVPQPTPVISDLFAGLT